MEGQQEGEAYVYYQKCLNYFNVEGDVFYAKDGKLRIALKQARCRCGGELAALHIRSFHTLSHPAKMTLYV